MPSLAEIKLIAIAIGLVMLMAGTAIVTHKVDDSQYLKLELKIAADHQKAVDAALAEQHQIDAVATKAAQDDARKQAAATASVKRQLAEVQIHVHAISSASHCITYGLVRVIDAAVHGVGAGTLALPAGKSDDACAPISAADLARSVVDNYGTARANSQQLNDLEAFSRDAKAAHDKAVAGRK